MYLIYSHAGNELPAGTLSSAPLILRCTCPSNPGSARGSDAEACATLYRVAVEQPCKHHEHGGANQPHLPVRPETARNKEITRQVQIGSDSPEGEREGNQRGWHQQRGQCQRRGSDQGDTARTRVPANTDHHKTRPFVHRLSSFRLYLRRRNLDEED